MDYDAQSDCRSEYCTDSISDDHCGAGKLDVHVSITVFFPQGAVTEVVQAGAHKHDNHSDDDHHAHGHDHGHCQYADIDRLSMAVKEGTERRAFAANLCWQTHRFAVIALLFVYRSHCSAGLATTLKGIQ